MTTLVVCYPVTIKCTVCEYSNYEWPAYFECMWWNMYIYVSAMVRRVVHIVMVLQTLMYLLRVSILQTLTLLSNLALIIDIKMIKMTTYKLSSNRQLQLFIWMFAKIYQLNLDKCPIFIYSGVGGGENSVCVKRCENIWKYVKRYEKMWKYMKRCEKIWKDMKR